MLNHLIISSFMVAITVAIHAGFMELALGRAVVDIDFFARHRIRPLYIVVVVLWLFLSIVIQASIWSALYLALGALPDLESSLYFSTVTYTTLGFGDVTLEPEWRLLSAFEAANGTIIIGWTTALVYAAVQLVYKMDEYE